MKYFAYGSNMCTKRLTDRVPSAVVDKIGTLNKFILKFHKYSNVDGSGKCDAFYTGNPSDKIYGVIFDFDESEKPSLDEVEGRGKGYDQVTIKIHAGDEEIHAFAYVANEKAIKDYLKPYTWYKDLVVSGAKEHLLPDFYIREIQSVEAMEDRNKEREKGNRELISSE